MRLEEMVSRFDERLKYAQSHDFPLSTRLYIQIMRDYYQRVVNAYENGQPVAWISPFHPPDLLYAMNVVPFSFEQYTIQMMASGNGFEYFERGEAYGYSKEACSLHLATIGLASSGLFKAPDVILSANGCDSVALMNEVLLDMLSRPAHFLGFPYTYQPEAISYLKRELEGLVAFVEAHTNKRLDEALFYQLLKRGQRITDYALKISALRKKVPSPFGTRESFGSFVIRTTNEGLPITEEYFKALYEEGLQRAKKGQGALKEERHRIVAMGTYPLWHMKLFDWLEKEHGAVIVVSLINAFSPPSEGEIKDPMQFMAEKLLYTSALGTPFFAQPFETTLENFLRSAEQAEVDGAIFFANFGCKLGCGVNRLFADALRERLGISTLILDLDSVNPTVVSAEQMKNKLNQYFSLLEERKREI